MFLSWQISLELMYGENEICFDNGIEINFSCVINNIERNLDFISRSKKMER